METIIYGKKSQILDLAAILTLNDLYYIMSYSESCD